MGDLHVPDEHDAAVVGEVWVVLRDGDGIAGFHARACATPILATLQRLRHRRTLITR